LLGFTEKEVGRMTLNKLLKLYRHYKTDYDFKLSGHSYRELEDMMAHDGEFIRD
jgi:hypothetical protein